MKRSAHPLVHQSTAPLEAPGLSFGVLRTAFVGVLFVLIILVGLFFFLRARAPHEPALATPKAAQAPLLRIAALSAATL
jgi:hypothetical protein